MERKRQSAAEVFYCFKTDARCSNKRIGDLLPRYLLEELSPDKVVSFEKHLRDCTACGAEVLTAWNLRAAVKGSAKTRSQKAAATGR
jgi:anti-sigma factor RsiW